jgi:hypothetical protein
MHTLTIKRKDLIDMNEIDKIILDSYQYLSSLGLGRFVYSGSYGLYLNGIDLGREFHDLDIEFPDLSLEEKKALKFEFTPEIERVLHIRQDLKFEEKDWNGIKLLVFTPESIIAAKRHILNFLETPGIIMTENRLSQKEKILRDLGYLKEHYGLE